MSEQTVIQWLELIQVKAGDTVILIKIPEARVSSAEITALLHAAKPFASDVLDAAAQRAHVCHGADSRETYVYFAVRMAELRTMIEALQRVVQGSYPNANITELSVTQAIEGASGSEAAHWHYVVETDVQPSAEDDFNAWYSEEHLPGLAAVPGTVKAVRLQNLTGSPRYHALYLLATRETFGSEPWLKVRATDWSSRVRPNFVNTKRAMFEVAPAAQHTSVTTFTR